MAPANQQPLVLSAPSRKRPQEQLRFLDIISTLIHPWQNSSLALSLRNLTLGSLKKHLIF
ncbi:Uncharacterised protein [Acinetobacter baumannii]|nr:Uncharacterised protein [Acinetobacter baumannii]